jgi:plastocyanin
VSRETTVRARSWSAALPLIAATALLGVAACPRPGTRPQTRRHVVEIRGFEYLPASLTVAVGDTVVWVNRDAVPHTATAADRDWDSGSIAAGGSWSRVFAAAGTAAYTCTFHPSMTGRLDIQ